MGVPQAWYVTFDFGPDLALSQLDACMVSVRTPKE